MRFLQFANGKNREGGVIKLRRSSVIHPETFATDYVFQSWHRVLRDSCTQLAGMSQTREN